MLVNKFAGKCAECNVPVEIRQGKVIKNHGVWEVYCLAHAEEAETRILDAAEAKRKKDEKNFEHFHKKAVEPWWEK